MAKDVKWQVNGIEQYSVSLGSNAQPNHGVSLFDVMQLLETEEGSGEYFQTGRHVSIAIPTSDLDEALSIPQNPEIQTYIRELLAWQLEPWSGTSANINQERLDVANASVDAFSQKVTDTWGGWPIQFSMP